MLRLDIRFSLLFGPERVPRPMSLDPLLGWFALILGKLAVHSRIWHFCSLVEPRGAGSASRGRSVPGMGVAAPTQTPSLPQSLLPPGAKPSGFPGLSFRPGDVPAGHTGHRHMPCLLHPFSSGLCLVAVTPVIAAGMQHSGNILSEGWQKEQQHREQSGFGKGGLPHQVPSGLLKGRAAVFSPPGSPRLSTTLSAGPAPCLATPI